MKNQQIERIEEMENIFTKVENAVHTLSDALSKWEETQADYDQLISYYHSKAWRKDVDFSDSEDFPKQMPCGVLSQDGVYNLIFEQRQLLETLIAKHQDFLKRLK